MQRLVVVFAVVVAACSPSAAGPSLEATPTGRPRLGTTDGCPPSFWATPETFDLWEEHSPDDLVGVFFSDPANYAELALADALLPTPGDDDAQRMLIREAVAAMLNAAHDSLDYPYSRYQAGIEDRPPIVPTVAELLKTGTASEMTDFARNLADANELGCPLR